MPEHQKQAIARLKGVGKFSGISGRAVFRQCRRGALVTVEVTGLPHHGADCHRDTFAMHVHNGGRCAGNTDDPFADVGGHYDPDHCGTPNEAGDLPPLFGCKGHAYLAVLTDRFRVEEIIGRTIIIHAGPTGGDKLACGEIRGI